MQGGLTSDVNEKSLSGHLFRMEAELDFIEQGELLEKIMLRWGWQRDSTAMMHLRN